MRIAVASFSHETCTFCPKPTTVDDFEAGKVLHGDDVLESTRGIPSYINGFIKTIYWTKKQMEIMAPSF